VPSIRSASIDLVDVVADPLDDRPAETDEQFRELDGHEFW
jgi:hypothetical protein